MAGRCWIFFGIIVLLCVSSSAAPHVTGTSTWSEGGAQFPQGELSGTVMANKTVQLAWNDVLRQTWTLMGGGQNPPARYTCAMAYDGAHRVFVLFGGQDGAAMFDDTWVYDPDVNSWTEKSTPVHPSARSNHAMAFDGRTGVVVLYGGDPGSSWSGETWLYFVANNSWVRVDPVHSPGPRQGHVMAWDPSTGLVVLFGGSNTAGSYPTDTWGFNVTTGDWKNLLPANAPEGRYSGSMALDQSSGLLVLFGGVQGYVGVMSDTWTYDPAANNWTQRTAQSSPAGRYMSDMAYDPFLRTVLLFGGFDSAAYRYFDDTWAFNASSGEWTRLYPDASPSARGDFSMAGGGGPLVLFGGYNPQSNALGDCWVYDLRGSYSSSGTFTSQPFDAGAPVHFGYLSWQADGASGTSVNFQLRGAATRENLSNVPFSGPDGKFDSYYTRDGQKASSHLDGCRWVQYRAFLGTTNPAGTPALRMVALGYNIPPVLGIESPSGAENWSGVRSISWSARDPDNDSMSFDLYLQGVAGESPLVKGLPDGTRSWEWNTSGTEPGTYRVRLVAREGNAHIPASAEASSKEFVLENPGWNHPPTVLLLSPPANATVRADAVNLTWEGRDVDSDPLTYRLFWSDRPFCETAPNVVETSGNGHALTGLANDTSYLWAVTPNDGKVDGAMSEIRRFHVEIPPPNHPPVFTSQPPAVATVGLNLVYQALGSDLDGDRLDYYLMSNISGMSMDQNNGRLSWKPKAGQMGNLSVALQVADGRGGVDWQNFTLQVRAIPPACAIGQPAQDQKTTGLLVLRGTATPGAVPIVSVQVRYDAGQWLDATGKQSWSYLLDTNLLKNGKHTVEARAFDGEVYSNVTAVRFAVDNGAHGTTLLPAGGASMYLAAMFLAVLLARLLREKESAR